MSFSSSSIRLSLEFSNFSSHSLLDLLKSRLETGQDSNGEILLVIEEIKRVLTY